MSSIHKSIGRDTWYESLFTAITTFSALESLIAPANITLSNHPRPPLLLYNPSLENRVRPSTAYFSIATKMEPSTTTTTPVSPRKKRVTSLRKMVKGARKAMEQRPDKKTSKSTGKNTISLETGSIAKTPTASSVLKDPSVNKLAQRRSKASDADFHYVYEANGHRHRRLQDTTLPQRQNSLKKLRGSHPYKIGRDFPHYVAGCDDDEEDDEVSLGSVETAIHPVLETRTNPGARSSWGTLGNSAGSATFTVTSNRQKAHDNFGDKQTSW
eukprot:scaffold39430_cov183-Amphora_coffeaeformis.AAC.1